MGKQEQLTFIRELSENVTNSILEDIKTGKVPDTWDGLELRRLLAHRFKEAVIGDMSRSRLSEFKNTLLVNDL